MLSLYVIILLINVFVLFCGGVLCSFYHYDFLSVWLVLSQAFLPKKGLEVTCEQAHLLLPSNLDYAIDSVTSQHRQGFLFITPCSFTESAFFPLAFRHFENYASTFTAETSEGGIHFPTPFPIT